MKITITGSLGHIGKPLTENLVKKGHQLTVISSRAEMNKPIIELGATPAIGSLEDVEFLFECFEGSDAIFTMYPPNDYFDQNLNLMAFYTEWSRNYARAILETGVKRVVNLSSIGGHLEKGNGIIGGANRVEQILNELPSEISIVHMRPSSFYTNLYGYMNTIKSEGKIYANFGSKSMPWVSPRDIALAVFEELTQPNSSRGVRYVASEELTGDEIAKTLGQAIGRPNLQWQIISDEEVAHALRAAGINPAIAKGLTEMYAAHQSGLMAEDYVKNKPKKMGKTKLKDFAEEFAKVYQGNH